MATTLLLIEDDPDDVLLIQRAFRKVHSSVRVQVINNGDEAIGYLSGKGAYANRKEYPLPSLIVLDLKIPRKSGLEVLAWLWERPVLDRLRVIVLTSSRQGTDIRRAYDLSAESYFVKPATYAELVELVKRIDVRSRTPAKAPAGALAHSEIDSDEFAVHRLGV